MIIRNTRVYRYKQKILLDCDGVIIDFLGGCEIIHNKIIEDWPPGEYNIAKVFGMSKNKFWNPVTNDFIYGLKYTKDYSDIMAVLSGYDITLLTAPTLHGFAGRYNWIKDYMPDLFRRRKYLIGPSKDICAHSNSILIDDSDKNCRDFILAGGFAILYPRPWNANHAIENPIEFLKRQLENNTTIL